MASRPSSRNEMAAAEITAFAAGAGPPENTIPTRLMWLPLRGWSFVTDGAAYRRFAVAGPPGQPISVSSDERFAGRVVAGVLIAAGQPTAGDISRANDGLSALGRPPLAESDFTGETPEALAPRIPSRLRGYLLALLYELAGDEPVRRRIADAYAGLWQDVAAPPAEPRKGSGVIRWIVGKLPRHQVGGASQEDVMERSPYR